jgi:hypothetical protein
VERAVVERAEAAQGETPDELRPALAAAARRLLGIEAASGPRFTMQVAPGGSSVAVMDVTASGVPPELAENLTRLLTLELRSFEGLSVVSRGEIQAMLRFASERETAACRSDTACLLRIGGALGVDYLVTGSVGMLGDAYVVALELMDIEAAQVVSRASQSFRGDATDLPAALRFAVWELLGKPVAGAGGLRVSANVDEGEVLVDRAAPTPYPHGDPFDGLAAGKHTVVLRSEGFEPLFRETYVADGLVTDLDLSLTPLPKPWYKQWWPWTIIGAVVAGATLTTVLLTLPDDPGPGRVTATLEAP